MRNPIRSLLLLVTTCLYAFAGAQTAIFTPAPEDLSQLTALAGKYQQRYKEEVSAFTGKDRKDYQDLYAQRWEHIKERFDKQEVYTSSNAQGYLDALVAEIRKGNPQLRDQAFSCYFSRSWIPNAAYIGEGIILFNMGLFDRMKDESQVAFVLCHEISHFVLRHSENGIRNYVTTLNSEEVQAKLRKIKRSEFGKSEQVEKLVKGLTFDSRRHSRDHESQADSMAVVLLRNTRFNLQGAVTTLALLDVIDTDTLNTAVCLPHVFNASGYPFQKRWIAKEEGLLGGHAKLQKDGLEDSLKTHPDCPARIKLLTPMIGQSVSGSRFLVDSAKFESLRQLFRYEVIEYTWGSDNYSRGLYLALESLQANPADPWLVGQTGKFLNGIYAAQKAHRLSKVVSLPSPDYPSNYNLLLQFIQNLYLDDLASISYNYLLAWHPQLDAYKPYKLAYEDSKRNMGK